MKFDLSDKDFSERLTMIETKATNLASYIKVLKDNGIIYDEDTKRIKDQILSLVKEGELLVVLTALKGIIDG